MKLIGQLNRLRVLAELDTCGTFSAAAERLGMSQSAVSQHVQALETSLDMRLVERATRPVQLTVAGAALVRHVRAVIARLDGAEQELAEIAARRSGRLRFGSFPTALATFVPAMLARFQRRHPEVTLTVVDDHLQRLIPRLHDGELDLAIVYDDPANPLAADPSLTSSHLFDDPFRVVLPHRHPLAARDEPLALAQLRQENWIGGTASSAWFRIVRQTCRSIGFDPRVALVSDDYLAVQAFAAAGLGVTVVPGLAAKNAPQGVVTRSIKGPAPVRRLWAARVSDPYPSRATVAMLEILTT